MAAGALVVDIRPLEQRREHGRFPGALVIGRTVLEWRLDPQSPDRIPEADYDRPVVIVCQEGYSSSLAAATLQLIGLRHATDLAGGVDAWIESGRPLARWIEGPEPRPHHVRQESRTDRISSP